MDLSHSSITSTTSTTSHGMFSRGHSSKSSQSSLASPTPTRDSFDVVCKRLQDVREEDDIYGFGPKVHQSFEEHRQNDSAIALSQSPCPSSYQPPAFLDQDSWPTASNRRHLKRQRSLDRPIRNVTQGLSSRFGSISRRFKNRSAASPQLSIITHNAPTATRPGGVDPTTNMFEFPEHEPNSFDDYCHPSPDYSMFDEDPQDSEVVPICIDSSVAQSGDEDSKYALTPLLPPVMMGMRKQDTPVQSPLQSPSVAAAGPLPSPPLSSQPSHASMGIARSRANTNQDVPPLNLLNDIWLMRLGHADFTINPEPYFPNSIDIDSYAVFRSHWEAARTSYAQHLARTAEHYGETSRVFKLTEEKWKGIDDMWKRYDNLLSRAITPVIARQSNSSSEPQSPFPLLEKPVTRIVIPPLDNKFPDLGDHDIIGPLSVGPSKVPELQRIGYPTPPASPRRRSLMRAISEIFARH